MNPQRTSFSKALSVHQVLTSVWHSVESGRFRNLVTNEIVISVNENATIFKDNRESKLSLLDYGRKHPLSHLSQLFKLFLFIESFHYYFHDFSAARIVWGLIILSQQWCFSWHRSENNYFPSLSCESILVV